MTTQSQTNRTVLSIEDLMILGMGVTTGTLIALFILGLVAGYGPRAGSDLSPLLAWIPGQLRETLISEASLMGWPLVGETPAYWYMSRGAGLVAYLMLWAATALGLVISTKIGKGLVAAPAVASLHEFLSLGALAFSTFHALVLLGDSYINFGLADVVYPFIASYRPGWVGLGQLGFYLSTMLTLSFYARKRIGPKTWRSLHYLTFLAYAMVVVHGLTSGTDTSVLSVQLMYLGTAGVIIFLIYYRLLSIG